MVGLTALASFGLGSSGRLYLLVVPIGALILLGVRAGIVMSVLSVMTMMAFAILAAQGVLANWLIGDRNSLLLADWLAEFVDTILLLATVMALLIMFYRFQERTIARVRRTHADLLHAQELLEQQNVTLEQKVTERTSELQSTNLNLEQRNAELAMLNSVSEAMVKTLDVKTMTRLVGDQVRQLFDADGVEIMLLDRQTNLIHVAYEYDENEGGYLNYVEPFPLGTGLASKVINSGQPLLASTLEEELANGAYFPSEIIARGAGDFSQSWLGVPIMANDQTLGLVALSDARPCAFTEDQQRLLQTLSANVGTALDNARLFQAEQQRTHELTIINSIQLGLATQLEIQAIYDLVGNEIVKIFNAQVVMISTYDAETDTIEHRYAIERGERIYVTGPQPLRGFRQQIVETRRSVLVNTDVVARADAAGTTRAARDAPAQILARRADAGWRSGDGHPESAECRRRECVHRGRCSPGRNAG